MQKYSYESILSAVGRVLDQAEARGFAVTEREDGLVLDMTDGAGAAQSLHMDLPDLVRLVDWSTRADTTPHYARAAAADEGTLSHLLERQQHELVGTR